ncbi:putative F-box/FBD/LRR-repeat protein At4g03220 [Carica papaya]|uniref:putative F-box/FBD/LRR-repeat protein At4g03220 n=1 Tax=Carica papaya TaxID=3649 RepID=UPI000B8D0BD6|nr:putative F-box/FBD/LRR-repeat protein At4g03220 [Carica papaya]
METRSAKRKKLLFTEEKEEDDGMDRISDLPDVVLQQILFLLPIKTIAKTSVLSKRWRSLWSSFPDLDFTTVNPLIKSSQCCLPTQGMDLITHVLSLRDKHSDIRILRFRAPLSFSHLNALVRRAIRQKVQELDVEVATDDYFNFPRCLISSDSLRVFHLKSRYPGFRLPPSSVMVGGFRFLQTLSLSLVILYNQPCLDDLFTESSFPLLKKMNLDACFGLKQLKIGCRALEDLTLENCFQLHGLDVWGKKVERLKVASCFDAYGDKNWVKINAPRLKVIIWEYNAVTAISCLENLMGLEEASIGLFVLHEDVTTEKLHCVSSLLSGLMHARSLTIERHCIEILSNKNYFGHLVHSFKNLKFLELHTGFNRHNIPGLACLFRCSPTLHTLVLKIINDYKIERRQWNKDLWEMSTTDVEQYWESETQSLKAFLNHLNVVKIHGFLDCENEVILAKFLLKHGKALQEMTLCIGHCNFRDSLRRQKIRSQMMGFSWASSNAKISFKLN